MREALQHARVMLLFSPALSGDADPLVALAAALPWIDVIQIRPKPTGTASGSQALCGARDTYDWCVRVLDLVARDSDRDTLVLVDDRVDVAAALWSRGCAGVHVGQDDCPVAEARAFLGREPLIGLSTHDMLQVVESGELPVDYLGFGPIHATATKGYARGVGAEACWIAREAARRPLFAIGGIDAVNVGELAHVGRIAVGSAILAAADPARAAREIRGLLDAEARFG